MNARRTFGGIPRSGQRGRVNAVLGPTNTGKTHFAVERMLAHGSGIVGLPLRLLAREVYEKVVRVKGARLSALVTGEEKIVPPDARYFVCTVEAMPLDLRVDFVAVDEIQLCADFERGHIFTDRLLHARGEAETIFLGAETMRASIHRFVPEARFIARPRFSDLAYTGHKKLTRVPRRAAIVAFSAEDVYGIADIVRRQRGGAAVVLGALSPRTRNAQVALFQSGDVDFLVATDAIGMGLNMDVDHIAFAALDKFDGLGIRALRPDELGQIAGRAGRHMNDGTFGVTADAEPLDDETVSRLEAHRYEAVRILQWRNSALSFHSLAALLGSLDEPPPLRGLAKARPSLDVSSLRLLAAQEDVRDRARRPAALKRLWDACQLPDFRKLSVEEHVRLVSRIYGHLTSESGVLPNDWLRRQVARLDDVTGDVATLSGRLAQIRTWTYAAHRPGWVEDSAHWQERTRTVEDRLSDALHERLTQRFVDRRTAVLMRRLRDDELPTFAVDESGTVSIEGEIAGKLDGFRFTPNAGAEGIQGRTLRAAALKGLEHEFRARAERLARAADGEIALSEHGRLWWDGAIVARLARGSSVLEPGLALVADDALQHEFRQIAKNRLASWLARQIGTRLEPLPALRRAAIAKSGSDAGLPAEARGVAHQLCEGFGSLDRRRATLPPDEEPARRALRPFGVKFARRSIFIPKLLRPDACSLLVVLWGIWAELDRIPACPPPGIASFELEGATMPESAAVAGFCNVAARAVRLDMLERVEEELETAVAEGQSADRVAGKIVSLLGCDRAAVERVVDGIGWRRVAVADPKSPASVWRRKPTQRDPRAGEATHRHARPARGSPFAGLATLIAAE